MPPAATREPRAPFDYPYPEPPADGHPLLVAPGVHWLRQPLPFELAHINLWILDAPEGPVLVDTGVRGADTQRNWRSALANFERPPSRLIVTHMHPDHAGAAGWLCDTYSIRLAMTRTEYLMCRVLTADIAPPPPAATEFFRAAGLDAAGLDRYRQMFGGFGKASDTLPPTYDRLSDGQVLRIGANDWQVVVGSGHSPEHACLYAPDLNVIIAGDQILPTISSNVSVWPTEPDANPLRDWLSSCRHLIDVLPADVLVLPSHGKPFVGAHKRLQALITEHERALERLTVLCREPQRAIDTFAALFRVDVRASGVSLAVGEAIAHLNYLRHHGAMTTWLDDDGIRWYQSH